MNLTRNIFDPTNISFYQKKFSKRVAIFMFKVIFKHSLNTFQIVKKAAVKPPFTAGIFFSKKYSEGDARLTVIKIMVQTFFTSDKGLPKTQKKTKQKRVSFVVHSFGFEVHRL